MLNLFLGSQFGITWATIKASTSWTQARHYFGGLDKVPFESEIGPTEDIYNPLENAMEEHWHKSLTEGPKEGGMLDFVSPSWVGTVSRPVALAGVLESRHPLKPISFPWVSCICPGRPRRNKRQFRCTKPRQVKNG